MIVFNGRYYCFRFYILVLLLLGLRAYPSVVGVLVEVFVETELEQRQSGPCSRVLEGHGADELEDTHGLGLSEDVVELVHHLAKKNIHI